MVNFPSGLRELSQLGDGVLLAHLTDEIAPLMLNSGPSWPTLGFPAPVRPEPLPDATAGWWSAAQLEPKPAASARSRAIPTITRSLCRRQKRCGGRLRIM